MSTTLNLERFGIYQQRDGKIINANFEWTEVPGNPATRYFAESPLNRQYHMWKPDGKYGKPNNPEFDLIRELDSKTAEEILKGRAKAGHIAPPGTQLFLMVQTGEDHGEWKLLPKTGA